MSELFTDPSLGDNLNIVLVGLIVLEGDEVGVFCVQWRLSMC